MTYAEYCATKCPEGCGKGLLTECAPPHHWIATTCRYIPCTAPTRDQFEAELQERIRLIEPAIEAIHEVWGSTCPDCGPDRYELIAKHVIDRIAELDLENGEIYDVRRENAQLETLLQEDSSTHAISVFIAQIKAKDADLEAMRDRVIELEYKAIPTRQHSDESWRGKVADKDAELDRLRKALENAKDSLFLALTQNSNCLNGSAQRTCREGFDKAYRALNQQPPEPAETKS